MRGTIYALADPVTEEIRYVGKTSGDVRRRLSTHLHNARRPRGEAQQRRLWSWLRSLQEKPLLIVLEEAEDVDEAERRWIGDLRKRGARLCNMTDGGDGLSGEGLAKSIAFHTGRKRPPETGSRISAALKGKPRSEAHLHAGREHSERMRGEGNSFYGKHHSAETKALLSEKRKEFRHTPESRAKISASLRATNVERGFHVSEEARERIAESKRSQWADPEWRERQIAAIRAGHARRSAK